VIPGYYDIAAVSEHILLNIRRNLMIVSLETSVNLGILREGNANNDDRVNILDFGLPVTNYFKMAPIEVP
jgi:hypothetical protein